jgi:hypothetical protein
MVVEDKSNPPDNFRTDVSIKVGIQDEITRININVPLSTRKLWKTTAAQEDTTMGELITRAMTMYLSGKKS